MYMFRLIIRSNVPSLLTSLLWTSLIGALLSTGCSRGETEHGFQTYHEDGYTIAVTTGGPYYDYPPFRLEELSRVQQDPSVPASLLSQPHRFSPGPDNTLIITERIDGRVLVFDDSGKFIRQIGSEGEGPGEFSRISGIQVVGDSLVIFDRGLRRISILSISGHLINTISTNDFGRQRIVQLLPNNRLVICATTPPADSASISIRLADLDNASIHATFWSGAVEQIPAAWSSGRVIASAPIPFVGSPYASLVSHSSIIAFSGATPELRLYYSNGNLERVIRLNMPSRRVTSQMIDYYWDEEERRRIIAGAPALEARVKAEKHFPKVAGWWSGAVMDDYGYLWVQDAIYGPLTGEPRQYYIFNPEGRYIGNMELPSGARFRWQRLMIAQGKLYALVTDEETGGYTPIVYRILPVSNAVHYP